MYTRTHHLVDEPDFVLQQVNVDPLGFGGLSAAHDEAGDAAMRKLAWLVRSAHPSARLGMRMRANELTDAFDRLLPFGEETSITVPDVRHLRPDL